MDRAIHDVFALAIILMASSVSLAEESVNQSFFLIVIFHLINDKQFGEKIIQKWTQPSFKIERARL